MTIYVARAKHGLKQAMPADYVRVREKDFENLAENFYLCTEEIHFLFYHEGGGFI
jgi:hypothetical protein